MIRLEHHAEVFKRSLDSGITPKELLLKKHACLGELSDQTAKFQRASMASGFERSEGTVGCITVEWSWKETKQGDFSTLSGTQN